MRALAAGIGRRVHQHVERLTPDGSVPTCAGDREMSHVGWIEAGGLDVERCT
jgi:hypothetical protein